MVCVSAFEFVRPVLKKLVFCCLALLHVGLLHAQTCAMPGKNGPASITGIVNTYYQPQSTGSVTAGTTSIPLGASTGAAATPSPGDQFVIIQMQCENINTTNTNNYGGANGTGSGYTDPAGSCLAGRYQYLRAGPATTATLLDLVGSPLTGTYVQDALATTSRRTYQIVRVPQYSSATISGNLTAPYWNGTTGGVVILDVAGSLAMGGSIDVAGRGFRGGGGQVWNNTADTAITYVTATNITTNLAAFKGEGIAGSPAYIYDSVTNSVVATGTDYTGGGQGKGAPGNAGGGGDNWNGQRDNGGGGGGSNGGIGGFGGYGWSGAGWPAGTGQDLRGIGGAAFAQAATSRLVMGGGGGAGANNNSAGVTSSGGSGGGIVMIRAGTMTGTGTINANGTIGQTQVSNDSGGGGGAGGSVLVNTASNAVGALTINAVGGGGGNGFAPGGTAHAGGGGGSGGVIYTDGGFTNVAGGANGITNVGDCPTTGVAPCSAANGATSGAGGVSGGVGGDPSGTGAGALCLPALTVTKATSTPLISVAGATTATYTISVANTGNGAAIGADIVDNTLPPGWTFASTTSVVFTPALSAATFGGFIESATPGVPAVASSPGTVANLTTNGTPVAAPVWNNLTIPGNGNVVLTFVVTVPVTASAATYHNPAGVKYLDPTRTVATREVAPAANNTSNRAGAQVGGTVNTTYETGASAGGAIPGSNYNGLVAGAAGENVTLTADLSVVKTHTPATLPISGAALAGTYTIVVRNNGRAIQDVTYAGNQTTDATLAQLTAAPLTVTDTLPTGFSLDSTPTVTGADAANWACVGVAGAASFTCTRNPNTAAMAAATDLVSISVPVRIAASACPGPQVNTATISTAAIGEATNTANNASADSTPVNCAAAVIITKTDARSAVAVGATTTYTITVTNNGPAAADGAVLQDPVGTRLTKTGAVTCTYGGTATGPAAPTIAQLEAGFVITTLPVGGTVSCILSAIVN